MRRWRRISSSKWAWVENEYPAVAAYLKPFQKAAEKRYDKGDYWWELRACDYYEEFEKPKIIYPNICKEPEFTFDNDSNYTNQKCFIISVPDKYLLGILNSKLNYFLFMMTLPKLRGGFYEPSSVFFTNFPIRPIDPSDPADVARHDRMVSLVEKMLDLNRRLAGARTGQDKIFISREIEATDARIDALVYELYGLSEEEIALIERAVRS